MSPTTNSVSCPISPVAARPSARFAAEYLRGLALIEGHRLHRAFDKAEHRGRIDNGGFEEVAHTGLKLGELPVKFGRATDQFVIKHRPGIMGARDRFAQPHLALTDQFDEPLARRAAEHFVGNPDLRRTIQIAQAADDLKQEAGRVFQLRLEVRSVVAEPGEGLGRRSLAGDDEFVRTKVQFLEAIGQGIDADPVLARDEGPFLKRLGRDARPLRLIADLGHAARNVADPAQRLGDRRRRRAADKATGERNGQLAKAQGDPVTRLAIGIAQTRGRLLRAALHLVRGPALNVVRLLERLFELVDPGFDIDDKTGEIGLHDLPQNVKSPSASGAL